MLSDNLKRYRQKKGFTQEELAMRLHVVRQTVSKWEKGLSVPDADLLQRLAEVLDGLGHQGEGQAGAQDGEGQDRTPDRP